VPANTAKADYASAMVEVSPGTISKFYRLFPPGCVGKVHLQVFYQTRQIFPTTPGQSYLGDGSEILGDASVELDEPEYVLELRGWSPGTSYDHGIFVEFYIARPVVYVPVVTTSAFVPVPELGG
jgi:hypothetical protein